MISNTLVFKIVSGLLSTDQRGQLDKDNYNVYSIAAQREIYESYFPELGRSEATYGRMSTMYGNIPENIMEKIRNFESEDQLSATGSIVSLNNLSPDFYRLGSIFLNGIHAMEANHEDVTHEFRSPLTAPTGDSPRYVRTGASIETFPRSLAADEVTIEYIRDIQDPNWTGMVTSSAFLPAYSGSALSDAATGFVNFELHKSELVPLVSKILSMAGAEIRSSEISQFAAQQEAVSVRDRA